MAERKKALVLGVGPLNGLGAAIARRFVCEGHHVFIAGRTESQLNDVADALRAEGSKPNSEVTPIVANATDEVAVSVLFDQITHAEGHLDVAIYNVGNNRPGKIREMEAGYFEAAWRAGCLGGFLFGREATRRMLPSGGTLIFTGASASLRGAQALAHLTWRKPVYAH